MDIQHNIDLSTYNTFKLACTATNFLEIKNSQDFLERLISQDISHEDLCIIGGGSNILLTTSVLDKYVCINQILGKEIHTHNTTHDLVHVGAGENRDQFVQRSIEKGYVGLENLISIPGSVGAAPMQNIGAYGVEVGKHIHEVSYINLIDKSIHSISGKDCHFGYRDSIFKQAFKGKICIISVTFLLEKYVPASYQPNISYGAIQEHIVGKELSPTLIASTIAKIRASKLPNRQELGTAGSFFKNPYISQEKFQQLQATFPQLRSYPVPNSTQVKLNAGQLIDLCGYKGHRAGNVGTYDKHALVLVHYGGATGQDIVQLAQEIQHKVKETFTVDIYPEVNYLK